MCVRAFFIFARVCSSLLKMGGGYDLRQFSEPDAFFLHLVLPCLCGGLLALQLCVGRFQQNQVLFYLLTAHTRRKRSSVVYCSKLEHAQHVHVRSGREIEIEIENAREHIRLCSKLCALLFQFHLHLFIGLHITKRQDVCPQ